jgi:hypothetical protein
MIRLVAVAFVVALASSAQAFPLGPIQQPDSMVTTVRDACGAGMTRVNGVCVRTPATKRAVRCAIGMRLVEGHCVM